MLGKYWANNRKILGKHLEKKKHQQQQKQQEQVQQQLLDFEN